MTEIKSNQELNLEILSKLERIESKIDNFMGFEEISNEEKEELNIISDEMKKGKFSSYDDVFN